MSLARRMWRALSHCSDVASTLRGTLYFFACDGRVVFIHLARLYGERTLRSVAGATRGLGGWRQLNSYKVRVLLGWLVSLGCLGHSALRSVARRARPLGGVL